MFLWKIVKDGFEPSEGLAGPQNVDIRRTLTPAGKGEGMVRVEYTSPSGQTTDFWIDRA